VTCLVRQARPAFFVRPRGACEQPRTVTLLLPDGRRRHGGTVGSLAAAWNFIGRQIPDFVVDDGTRLEVRREPDGTVDGVVAYSRARG